MAGGHSAVVVRNGASAFHHLLQLMASAMESDLDRGDGHSQEVGDLRRGEGGKSLPCCQNQELASGVESLMARCGGRTGASALHKVKGRGQECPRHTTARAS